MRTLMLARASLIQGYCGLRWLALGLQDQLSCCLPALNVLRRLHDITELVHFVDLDIESIVLDELPQLLRGLLELFASRDVVEERWADELYVLWREATGLVSIVPMSAWV
jgi:hypothetical protein